MAEGKKQSEAGDPEKGAATYRQALALDPLRKLEPDGEARRDYANTLVQQGSELAQSGNTKGATAKFKQALTIDPAVSIGDPTDPALHATRIYAYTFADSGYRLAYGCDQQGAIAKFRQALTIDPTLEINPELQAKQTCASVLSETGLALAEAGNLDSADRGLPAGPRPGPDVGHRAREEGPMDLCACPAGRGKQSGRKG